MRLEPGNEPQAQGHVNRSGDRNSDLELRTSEDSIAGGTATDGLQRLPTNVHEQVERRINTRPGMLTSAMADVSWSLAPGDTGSLKYRRPCRQRGCSSGGGPSSGGLCHIS